MGSLRGTISTVGRVRIPPLAPPSARTYGEVNYFGSHPYRNQKFGVCVEHLLVIGLLTFARGSLLLFLFGMVQRTMQQRYVWITW